MGAGGGFSASDGPGGKASRFLDAVVAFVVAIFHPILGSLVSLISPSKSSASAQSQSPSQSRSQRDQTAKQHPTVNNKGQHQPQHQPHHRHHDADIDADTVATTQHTTTTPSTMQRQLQTKPAAAEWPPSPACGPPALGANGSPAPKAALPRMGPASGAVKQENIPTSTTAAKNERDIANAINGSKMRAVGKEQAEENRQEQLTLPPLSEPATEQDHVRNHPVEPEDPAEAAERAVHHGFMNQALDMARLSLKTNETPVGCVLVHDGKVVARGMNATNVTRNGTRHAELMALTALLSFTPKCDTEAQEKPKKAAIKSKDKYPASPKPEKPPLHRSYTEQEWGDVDPSDGHIYPYGQKLHPAPRVDRSLISECTLYVTVEPCVMCASMLRQFGIKKVYFGAVNDKFGGTGGVFCIHMNSDPAYKVPLPANPIHRPVANQMPRQPLQQKPACSAASVNGSQEGSAPSGPGVKMVNGIIFVEPPVPVSNMSMGHGGNVEDGFEAEGGWGRDEAVNLLRQFYVQENGRAPVPRKKEGRAARLAAMMESQGLSTEGTALAGLVQQERECAQTEDAAMEGADPCDAGTTLEAKPNANLEQEEADSCNGQDKNKTQSSEQPVQESVMG